MMSLLGKTCIRCGETYLGFGRDCTNCKAKPVVRKKKCRMCSKEFTGNRTRCAECIAAGHGAIEGSTPLQDPNGNLEQLSEFLDDYSVDEVSVFEKYWSMIEEYWQSLTGEARAQWSVTEWTADTIKYLHDAMDRKRLELDYSIKLEINKCFAAHDKDADGELVGEEIHTFLQDYASTQLRACECIVKCGAEMSMMRAAPDQDPDPEMMEAMNSAMFQVLKERHHAYMEEPRKYNMFASRALDKRRTGRLQLDDVVQGLLPGSSLNKRFTRYLPTLLTWGVFPEWCPCSEHRGDNASLNSNRPRIPTLMLS